MHLGQRGANFSDVAELTLIRPGGSLFLYTDGVYDGSDQEERETRIDHARALPAKESQT